MSPYQLEIAAVAKEEYFSAFSFYFEHQSELGNKFEKEAGIILNNLKANPYIYQRKFKHYREAVFKKFPYCIIYEIIDDLVIINSFFHTKRDPRKKLEGRE